MIAILGTESDVGKTQLIAGLSYIFREYNPFPFKAQNMSLNAYVGVDNGEMAFAQSWQAIAGNTAPLSCMNPVLLKPVSTGKTEIILFGKSIGTAKPKEYWGVYKKRLRGIVFDFFSGLIKKRKIIFIEGAGSCSEINFKREDFANLELCKVFKIPFILVADIERGGAFAKIVGTYELMDSKEKELFQGIIINKMSGDKSLLSDGIRFIERKTKRKVIGVVSFINDLNLPEEDSMMFHRESIARKPRKKNREKIVVKVIKTPYVSNFFDIYPLTLDKNFELSWASSYSELDGADIMVLAGSRNVFADLKFIKDRGIDEKIKSEIRKGKSIIAICGGYEILFKKIKDKWGIESEDKREKELEGLGLIKDDINFKREKIVGWETLNIKANWFSGKIKGFNIRHGDSKTKYFSSENILGCFLHNIFWNDSFIKALLRKFGLESDGNIQSKIENELKKWANHLKEDVDINYIKGIIL